VVVREGSIEEPYGLLAEERVEAEKPSSRLI